MVKIKYIFPLLAACLMMTACNDDVVPKPSGLLRLEYREAAYVPFENRCPFRFALNEDAIIKENGYCNLTINYPKMKATVYLTYKPVENNINTLLRDAQKLTYEHVIKADDILEQPFLNAPDRVFGMYYQVQGNAATNAQFYVTDSINHFVTGSVYFYAKPNFDSVMPAASYIKNDMRMIMQSLNWK